MEDVKLIEDLLKPKILELGFSLSEISLRKNGKDLCLSIIIDRKEEIDLEAISKVSDEISKILDEKDPIKSNYILDVSSLGIEKPIPIENLKEYQGSYVNIHLTHPLDGENILEGEIMDINDKTLIIAYKVKTRLVKKEVLLDVIDRARLAIKF